MKKTVLAGLLVAALSLVSFRPLEELPIGSAIPKSAVKMKDISGQQVSLADVTDKNGLLVMFSCNTCPYVIKNEARTKEICAYAREHNIGVVLVNSNEAQRTDDDSFDEMKAYGKKMGYSWYYVLDPKSEMADAFGASRTPESFLFNKEGKLVYHGAIDDNPADADHIERKHLKVAIDETLAGKDVTIKTSRSVGCGIKRV